MSCGSQAWPVTARDVISFKAAAESNGSRGRPRVVRVGNSGVVYKGGGVNIEGGQ